MRPRPGHRALVRRVRLTRTQSPRIRQSSRLDAAADTLLPVDEQRAIANLALELEPSKAAEEPVALSNVFGVLRDGPLERPTQGSFEIRDELS